MIIGVPKEIKEQEQRVGLLPSAAKQLTRGSHSVLVEKNAGIGSGYPDEEYANAGAEIVDQAKEVFARADMIVKVKEPLEAEFPLLRKGQILFTYLHLAASKPLTEALLKSGVTAVAYETIQVDHRLPLLEPMSEIAGRMSVVMGANFLAKYNGGSGVLLGGVPGVLPGKVVVLGGGSSGINAARMAQGLGADVTILEVDLERMRFLDITLHTAHTLYSNEAHLLELLPAVDLLIGAVLVPGARAPKLIGRGLERWTGFSDLPRPLVVFIGVTEVLGAAGLVLPMATGIVPWLTPLAAVGVGIIVLMATGFHLRADERVNALETGLWASIAAVIAIGRWDLVPTHTHAPAGVLVLALALLVPAVIINLVVLFRRPVNSG